MLDTPRLRHPPPSTHTAMSHLAAINTQSRFGNEVRSRPSISHLVLKSEGAVIGVRPTPPAALMSPVLRDIPIQLNLSSAHTHTHTQALARHGGGAHSRCYGGSLTSSADSLSRCPFKFAHVWYRISKIELHAKRVCVFTGRLCTEAQEETAALNEFIFRDYG